MVSDKDFFGNDYLCVGKFKAFMKILVCISKTPDTTSKIAFDSDNMHLKEEGVSFIMNPYDEWYALVRGIELREKLGGSVSVIHVGEAASEVIIRKALAIGADQAIRIDTKPKDSNDVATQIAHYAQNQSFDIVLLGKETIDHNGSEVGALLAGMLAIPFISYCTKLDVEGNELSATSEIEGGEVSLKTQLPAVVSAAKGMAEQRIPNMKGIMDAKKKPLEVISPVSDTQKVKLVRFEALPPKTAVKLIAPDDIESLVKILHEEVKVI